MTKEEKKEKLKELKKACEKMTESIESALKDDWRRFNYSSIDLKNQLGTSEEKFYH